MRLRRLLLRLLLGLLVLVVVAVVGGYVYERPLLLTGTGYAAHNDCAVRQLAGRTDPQNDLPPNPLVPYLRTSADGTEYTSTVLGLLASSTAWSTAHGCVLADQAPAAGGATAVTAPAAGTDPWAGQAAPAPSPALTTALGKAFGDDLPAADRAALGTRAVVVIQDGKLVAERYADGFTQDTRQLGWSMSKSVTSMIAGRLVQQGKLKVTDDHLRPEWTDDRAKITVEDLLRMSSGLAWDETYDLGTPITKMLYIEPDMAAYVASQPLAHPHGTYQQYSSGSTNLLSSILAERSGAGPDTPRRELFDPLGLASPVLETDAVGTPVGSSYLWATPRDWAALGQFALDDGVWRGTRLLPEGWIKFTTTDAGIAGEETGYAAGWRVNATASGKPLEPTLPADAYWMSGHDGQHVYIVPSARLVVVRLGFTPAEGDLRVLPLVAGLADGSITAS